MPAPPPGRASRSPHPSAPPLTRPGSPEIRSRPYADSVHQRRVPHPHGPRDRDPGRGGREGLRGRPPRLRPQGRAPGLPQGPRARGRRRRSGSRTRSRATSSSTCCPTRSPRRSRRRTSRSSAGRTSTSCPGSRRARSGSSPRLDLKPSVDPGEYRGVPVEDQSVEPTEEEVAKVIDRIREAHAEFHPIEGRAAAPGDFAVADIAGSFVEILAPGQNPRTFRDEKITLEVGHPDSMPEINDALPGRPARRDTRSFRKTFPDDFPNDEFRGQDRRLRGHARGPQGEEAARAWTTSSRGRSRRATRSSRSARRSARACATRRRRTAGASSAARSSTRSSPRRDVPAPEVLVESETTSALRDYARYLAASGVDPRRKTGRSSGRRRVRAPSVGSGSTCSSTRSPSARRSRSRKPSSRPSSSARPRERGVEPAVLREQMAKADGLDALRDEMRLARVVDLLIAGAKVLPSGMPVEVK